MLKRFAKRFIAPSKDKNEDDIRMEFAFLFSEYGFAFSKSDLGNVTDKNGKLLFYGPLNAYFIYNNRVCINMLYLVQRQEWTVYITDEYKEDQAYIRSGYTVDERFYSNGFSSLAAEIKSQLDAKGMIFDRSI